MAEAFFNQLARERGLALRGESAGTRGAGSLNPLVVQAMEEVGVSMDGHQPKQLTQEMADAAARTISMGCGVDATSCPTRFLVTDDWGLEDPVGQPLERVREIRDDIRQRVSLLIDQLG